MVGGGGREGWGVIRGRTTEDLISSGEGGGGGIAEDPVSSKWSFRVLYVCQWDPNDLR